VISGEWRVASQEGAFEKSYDAERNSGMPVAHYRELIVWQKALDLAHECYVASKRFPREELFGFTSQIRRSASSIPANIAEGQGRQHTKEFLHFLSIARGSLMELETHLILCNRVELLPADTLEQLLGRCDEVSRMLSGLRQALELKC
jgi:four helix bundle protein